MLVKGASTVMHLSTATAMVVYTLPVSAIWINGSRYGRKKGNTESLKYNCLDVFCYPFFICPHFIGQAEVWQRIHKDGQNLKQEVIKCLKWDSMFELYIKL